MTNRIVSGRKLKRIEDLSLKEIDMCYSLSRIGWSHSEIGRRYGIVEADVKTLVKDYVELRELCKTKMLNENEPSNPEGDLCTKKPRKRRSDAIYATEKDRQAAYRARLQERRHAGIEEPSPTVNTDMPMPAVEEISVTDCEVSVTEIGPENAETQHSACYGSSKESCDASEGGPFSVTLQPCGGSEALRLVEEEA
jgi:hypothetical protein